MAATSIEPSPEAGERPAGKTKADAVPTPAAQRVFWRAIVRSGGASRDRERERVEWHLAQCPVPREPGKHCSEGQHLIETTGHPDGHCIIEGRCGLCGAPERPEGEAEPAAATT